MPQSSGKSTAHRVDWVDHAKGICIILVVMMHSTLGVELAMGAKGWMADLVEWARPFRMPDFFLISGLFLARRIAAPWRDYLDKKVVHFLYFYVLWMTIQLLFKGYGIYKAEGPLGLAEAYGLAFLEPFGTLWFIYLLPVFFLVTRVTRRVPPLLVFAIAAGLEILPIHTGWIMIDEFAARFVYFFAGYWMAEKIFRFADDMNSLTAAGLISAMVIWGISHTRALQAGFDALPAMGLVLGFAGTLAVVTTGLLLQRFRLGAVFRYLGENSIVVYLAFFVFMASARVTSLRLVPEWGPDMIALVVTAAGVIGPVVLHALTQQTPLKYLFIRPRWARLENLGRLWQGREQDGTFHHPQIR